MMFPWNDKEGFRHWIMESSLNLKRTQLLSMINYPTDEDSLIVDIGCNIGYLTRPLSLRAETLGFDIDRKMLSSTKFYNRDLDFVCCDICHLPLKNSSVNLAVCCSVLEHVEKLTEAVKEIKRILRKGGTLAAGYPIETKLLEFAVRLLWKAQSHVWDQKNILKRKDRLEDPEAHKSSFIDIRKMLKRNFSIIKRQKIPNRYFPDPLSIYENVILVRNEEVRRKKSD